MADSSIVYWYSSLEKHLCGYCKNERGNISHGMWAKVLTVEDYQNLIDRGWRRSGNYCYKPVMNEICCPMYTIKCEVLNFRLSKSQKKVIKKFNKFLKDGVLNKNANQNNDEDNQENSDGVTDFVYREVPSHILDCDKETVDSEYSDTLVDCDQIDNVPRNRSDQKTSHTESVPSTSRTTAKIEQTKERKCQLKDGVGADPNKPLCKKAKLLRMERKKEKLLQRGMSVEKIKVKNEQKSLEELLHEIPEDTKHKFKLELVNTSSQTPEWEKLKTVEFALYKKYQMAVHNDPPEKCKMESFLRFLVNSPLQITLERIHEKHKHFRLTADLFAKYQIAIHNETPEECNEFQYLNFLIDTPLQHVKFSNDSEVGFGSFHQLYWLDDKLIAVGVIDILPKCVSAVYFFYDPDYRDLTLGTYGSLREVEFARALHEKVSSIENYYMGFYIHSCPKMRYKGKLSPSYLLCPETYHWISIEKCLGKLDASRYSRLDDDESATDENACTAKDVDQLKILVNRRLVLFKQFKRKFGGQELFNTIGQLIGQKCSRSIVFIGDH